MTVRWRMPAAVLIGKPLGLLAGVVLARVLGLHLPFHVGWRELVVVGFLEHDWLHDGALLRHRLGGTWRGSLRAEDGRSADAGGAG